MFAGPGFAFNMGGGPGIRIHQFGGNNPRRRPHNHENAQPTSPLAALQSLLPLLLLFILPLLSSLFSGSGQPGPSMRFDAAVPPHTLQHQTTGRLNIPYWVNPTEVKDYTPRKWKELDKVAEGKFTGQLVAECEWEQSRRRRLEEEARGFFVWDYAKLERARSMEMPSCTRLQGYGYRVS